MHRAAGFAGVKLKSPAADSRQRKTADMLTKVSTGMLGRGERRPQPADQLVVAIDVFEREAGLAQLFAEQHRRGPGWVARTLGIAGNVGFSPQPQLLEGFEYGWILGG